MEIFLTILFLGKTILFLGVKCFSHQRHVLLCILRKYVWCVGERRGERKENKKEGRERERRGYEGSVLTSKGTRRKIEISRI